MQYLLILALAFGLARAQPPKSAASIVNLEGTVQEVAARPGAGMPTLWISTSGGERVAVLLGSLRYLIENNFAPRVGDRIAVRGQLTAAGQILAYSVKLLPNGQELRLRDEKGSPLWIRGRYGRPGRSRIEEEK